MDGTLVTKAKALTPRAIEAIEQLHEHGVLFAITSGRPPRGMKMLVHPLEMQGPMAAFNGGIIVQPDMTIVDELPVPVEMPLAGGLSYDLVSGARLFGHAAIVSQVGSRSRHAQSEPSRKWRRRIANWVVNRMDSDGQPPTIAARMSRVSWNFGRDPV